MVDATGGVTRGRRWATENEAEKGNMLFATVLWRFGIHVIAFRQLVNKAIAI